MFLTSFNSFSRYFSFNLNIFNSFSHLFTYIEVLLILFSSFHWLSSLGFERYTKFVFIFYFVYCLFCLLFILLKTLKAQVRKGHKIIYWFNVLKFKRCVYSTVYYIWMTKIQFGIYVQGIYIVNNIYMYNIEMCSYKYNCQIYSFRQIVCQVQ